MFRTSFSVFKNFLKVKGQIVNNMATSEGCVYRKKKKDLLGKGELFEDPEFPAKPVSIGKDLKNIVWKRPAEILRDQGCKHQPVFIRNDATKADLDQGQLGDCWFIAASACLAVSNQHLFYNVIQPTHQSFEEGQYAGIFRFRFWRYGKWREVVIDDRLPTQNDRLVFAYNLEEPNEFWGPLMEKAYAKTLGSYSCLDGGHTANALVDFTGGLSETFNLKDKVPKNLYRIMNKSVRFNYMMGVTILATRTQQPDNLPNGLHKGHAYSVTAVTEVKTTDGKRHKLVRLRNPWGWKEWNGYWSDGCPFWSQVDQRRKSNVDFKKLDDGEFWISYEDLVKNFDTLDMCYLSPEHLSQELHNNTVHNLNKSAWNVIRYDGKWVRGVTAGGSGNPPFAALYQKNPKYCVKISDESVGKDGKCTIVVSLMKEDTIKTKNIRIGIQIYEESQGCLKVNSGYTYEREVTARLACPKGTYFIIPSTSKPDEELSYLLRIFFE